MYKKIILISIICVLIGLESYSEDLIGTENLYVVKRGDTIKNISSRYGITSDELLKANKIQNSNVIKPGQSLKITTQKNNSEENIQRSYY